MQSRKSFRIAVSNSRIGEGPTRFGYLPATATGCAASTTISQGSGAVVLGGVMSALRITGGNFSEQTFLFLGAGSAGIGIAHLLAKAMTLQGVSPEQARARIWLFNTTRTHRIHAWRLGRLSKTLRTPPRSDQELRRSNRVDQTHCHHRCQHGAEALQSAGYRGDGARQSAPDYLSRSQIRLRIPSARPKKHTTGPAAGRSSRAAVHFRHCDIKSARWCPDSATTCTSSRRLTWRFMRRRQLKSPMRCS